jgi:hypothetical protein
MKTIAILTMFYLPGAFVSSIFGWSIINFSVDEGTNEQTVVVADQWKIYIAITVSLTAATLGAWYLFLGANSHKISTTGGMASNGRTSMVGLAKRSHKQLKNLWTALGRPKRTKPQVDTELSEILQSIAIGEQTAPTN